VSLHVELVVPDREVWSGRASMVIAKTLDGDIGVLKSHPPVLGLIAAGSVVRILDPQSDPSGGDQAQPADDGQGENADGNGQGGGSPGGSGQELVAAVSGGFLSVADDRVSILATDAALASEIDIAAVRAELEEALAAGPEDTASGPGGSGTAGGAGAPRAAGEESARAKYARSQLRAAGEQA
jgi:F-type H+-transporting ATPase subunit epsilon